MLDISIVSTLYKSESYIKEFYQRSIISTEKIFKNIEFIFVNDGSQDASTQIIKDICDKDSRVTLIDLSRNFGHTKAVMTGLKHARGEYIWLIDIDLEDQPEWISIFHRKLIKENIDCVYGIQKHRKGKLFEKITGYLFYNITSPILNIEIPKNYTTARLMTKDYCSSLVEFQERNSVLIGLWSLVGYKQDFIKIDKQFTGNTTFTLRKKISLVVEIITSFSTFPLEFCFYFGIIILFFSILYSFYLIFNWLFFSTPLLGWTSLMASIWLLGGILISFVGLIGIYVSKVFIETKKRPYTTIREIYNSKNKK